MANNDKRINKALSAIAMQEKRMGAKVKEFV